MPIPVLIVIQSLGDGGSERQAAAVALHLDRSRFAVHVACVHEGHHADAFRAQGIPILKLPLNSFTNRTAFDSVRLLRAYIRRHRIALVHTFDYLVTGFAVPACSGTGAVVVSSQRCLMGLVPAKYHWPVRLAHLLARAIVVNCEAIRGDLVALGYKPERIHVCYNGLDTARFRPGPRIRLAGLERAGVVVGTVCVLRPEKNLSLLMRAFAAVSAGRPGMRLLIVGDGPEKERLQREADELGIGAACWFHPSTPDVAPCLRSMDVFVHPSLSEGLSNAVMEAMAAGCTVVSSNAGGTPELVVEGVTGLLFDPGDLAGFISQLTVAVEDGSLRQRLGGAASARIHGEFTLQAAVNRFEQLYESLLAVN